MFFCFFKFTHFYLIVEYVQFWACFIDKQCPCQRTSLLLQLWKQTCREDTLLHIKSLLKISSLQPENKYEYKNKLYTAQKIKKTHDHEGTVRLLRPQPIQEGSKTIVKLLHFLLQPGQMKEGRDSNKTCTTERLCYRMWPCKVSLSSSILALSWLVFAFFLGGSGSNGNMR